MNKLFLNSTLLFICAVIFCCCHKDKIAPKKSAEKSITSFKFKGFPDEKEQINQEKKTIQINLPAGTIVTALIPDIQVSAKATVSPISNQAQDFTNKVTYTVTAEDRTEQKYTVTVQVEGIPAPKEVPVPQSSEKKIISFKFFALTPDEVNGSLMKQQVVLQVPEGTDLRSLVPTIVISPKATITPSSGEAQDFSKGVIYNVTAEDGSKEPYLVFAIVAPKSYYKSLTQGDPFVITMNAPGNYEVALIDEENHSFLITKFEKLTDSKKIKFNIPDNIPPSTYSIRVSSYNHLYDYQQLDFIMNTKLIIKRAKPIIQAINP